MKLAELEKHGYKILKKEVIGVDLLGRKERWAVKRPDGMVVSCNIIVANTDEEGGQDE